MEFNLYVIVKTDDILTQLCVLFDPIKFRSIQFNFIIVTTELLFEFHSIIQRSSEWFFSCAKQCSASEIYQVVNQI